MLFYIFKSTFHSDPLYLFCGYQAKYHHSGLVFRFVCNNLGGQKLNYFSAIKIDLEQFSDGLHISRKIHQSLIPPFTCLKWGPPIILNSRDAKRVSS